MIVRVGSITVQVRKETQFEPGLIIETPAMHFGMPLALLADLRAALNTPLTAQEVEEEKVRAGKSI